MPDTVTFQRFMQEFQIMKLTRKKSNDLIIFLNMDQESENLIIRAEFPFQAEPDLE